jgi:hypothetical protein
MCPLCVRLMKLSLRKGSMHAQICSCHFNLHSGSLPVNKHSHTREPSRLLCSITHGLCAFLGAPCRHGQHSFCCLQTGNGSRGISSVPCDLPQHTDTSSVLHRACTHDTSDRGGYLHTGLAQGTDGGGHLHTGFAQCTDRGGYLPTGFAQGTDRGDYLHTGFAQDPDRDNWLRWKPIMVRQERLQVADLTSASG